MGVGGGGGGTGGGRGPREMPWGWLALVGALVLAGVLMVVQAGWLGGGGDEGDGASEAVMDGSPVTEVEEVAVMLPPTATTAAASAVGSPTAVLTDAACARDLRLAEPPEGLVDRDPMYPVWFGEVGAPLAVAPLVLSGVSTMFADTGVYWFAGGPQPMQWFGAEEPVVVTARLLDGNGGGGGSAAGAENGLTKQMESMAVGKRLQVMQAVFPEPGCWEVTATAGAAQTTLAVYVAPMGERPDVLYALAQRGTRPYAPPAACTDAVWSGPSDPLEMLWAAWWVEMTRERMAVETLALGSESAVFWAGRQATLRVHVDADRFGDAARVVGLEAEAESADGRVVSAGTTQTLPGHALGGLTFPEPGCWEVRIVEAGLTLARVDVFVYPADCWRAAATEPVPAGCTVLAGEP